MHNPFLERGVNHIPPIKKDICSPEEQLAAAFDLVEELELVLEHLAISLDPTYAD